MVSETNGTQSARPFRVLALDGGGIRGTYTASVLAELERMTGKRVIDHFDLVTGTSTGGIIAVALGMGIPADRVLNLYVEKGPAIFPSPWLWWVGRAGRFVKHLLRPKHSQQTLKAVFEEVVPNKRFGDSKVRLVIPAFDADRGTTYLFKTAHRDEYKQDYLLPASTVAMSTSAAPTYYTAYTDVSGACYLDGGVWANCPVMVGLIEAVWILNQPVENVHMLSIGTTDAPYHVSKRRRKGGIITWGRGGEAVTLFMQAQAAGSLGQARLILGDRLVRVDNVTTPGRFTMDNSKTISTLKVLGQQDARIHEREVSQRFLFAPAEPFVPFRHPPASMPGSAGASSQPGQVVSSS